MKMHKTELEWTTDGVRLATAADKHFMAEKRSCGEAILQAGCEALGIDNELIPDIALGLGGGIGLQGHVCGAVSGAALTISLAMAKKVPDYAARKMATFEAVGRCCRDVERRLGSAQCRQLCELDLTHPDELRKHVDEGKAEKCAGIVKEVAHVLAEELRRIAGGS